MSTTPAQTRRVDITGSCFLDTSTPIDTIEKIKFVLLFPFIILRLIGTFLVVLAAAGVGAVAGYGRKPGTPTPLWRRLIISLAVPVVRCLLLTWGFFYIRVEGREHLRKAMRERKNKPFIVLFNHVSLVDAPLVCWVLGMPGAVAKEEVRRASKGSRRAPLLPPSCHRPTAFLHPRPSLSPQVQQYPIVKHFLSGLELVYVKRGPKNVLGAGGLTSDIVKRVEDPRYLSPLCMAPEGTCSNGKCLMNFRTGAFVPGVAVLPLLIQYPHKRFNPAWTLQSAAVTFFRILGQFYNNACEKKCFSVL